MISVKENEEQGSKRKYPDYEKAKIVAKTFARVSSDPSLHWIRVVEATFPTSSEADREGKEPEAELPAGLRGELTRFKGTYLEISNTVRNYTRQKDKSYN